MDIIGSGKKTTHFGNNVLLKPGNYRVDVTVNHKIKSDFMLDVN
jgi:hypothetical protein